MLKRIFVVMILSALLLASCGQPVSTADAPANDPSQPDVINPADCTNSAAFVSDVTVPDNTNFKAGESFKKVWRVENTGTCTWSDDYSLVYSSGEKMNAPTSTPLSLTKPGDTLDIEVDLTAPSEESTFRADFEIHNPSGEAIAIDESTILWVIISVGDAPAAGSGGGSASSSGPGFATLTCAFTASQPNVDAVVAAVNSYRTKNGLPAYSVNPQLTQAAQAHAADMACNSIFTHNGSNDSTPASRVAFAGYAASSVTENVYGSYPPLSGSGVVTWWATDQTDTRHNANLVSTKYSQIGVGYAFFDNFGYYVLVFAAP